MKYCFLLFFLLVLGPSACGRLGPDALRVETLGEAPGRGAMVEALGAAPRIDAGALPDWADRQLAVEGSAPLELEIRPRAEALLLARRTARDAALRALADEVLALPLPEGGSVGAFLEADPARAERFGQILRKAVRPGDGETLSPTTLTLQLVLPLQGPALWLHGQSSPEAAEALEAQPPQLPRDMQRALNEAAYAEARKRAENRLAERLMALEIQPGYLVAERLRADPEARRLVERAIAGAREEAVAFPEPGRCRLRLAMDAEALLEALAR